MPGLPRQVERYGYDRGSQETGIVHFGIGAFHRAHQAVYTDRIMDAGERDWMIAGVSLRSGGVAAQMNPQEGLYTVTERSAHAMVTRVVGSVRDVLVADRDRERIVATLAAPATRIASFTVTEKGYCRAADATLDFAQADGGSFYPLLVEAMARRKASGVGGITLLSCDNLSDNGSQLARLMERYLEARAPDLSGWFEAECRCPSTMVDRIVPATTDADRQAVADLIGCTDAAAVVTEPFSQWIIEDRFAGSRPGWDCVGAQFVDDVAPFEAAKLRMLNGAHSALAYLGLERGYTFVHEAIADAGIRALVDRLMRQEAAPTIAAAAGQDLNAYADALLARFANPALRHRLAQIAMDGSQKVPQRWLATLTANQREGRDCPAIEAALAAWLRHVRGDNGPVDDPLADAMKALWRQAGESGIVAAMFGPRGLLASDWQAGAGAIALRPD